MQAGPVDPACVTPDGDPLGAAEDRAEELLPPSGAELLRVVQVRKRADAMVAQLA